MMEVQSEASYVPHHPKKIAFIFSAMRHFAESLKAENINIHYVSLTDKDNTHSIESEIVRLAKAHSIDEIILTEPGEYRMLELMKGLNTKYGLRIDIRDDKRFLASRAEFQKWAGDKKSLRMEFFYREMRKRYKILLEDDGTPIGGEWNFDKENRKPPTGIKKIPTRLSFKKDEITNNVLALVAETFPQNFGTLEPFHFAVTREQALKEAAHFIEHCLPFFGDFQDAMLAGEAFLYHSLLSSYLNVGLLLPLEICQMSETAYKENKVPLAAAEGFIRQILGWREYIRGLYWLKMPEYKELNYLNATRPLPEFYWTAKTKMACVSEAVTHTRDHAYSHHIQRLMVTGNFALLAGLSPEAVCEWYLAVYADAFEWVELPNTLGMALFGDGGIVGSKPYAASGKYINRMSNYCKNCAYDPDEIVGETACPFNALYWDFINRHDDKFRKNGRMVYMYATWDKMDSVKKSAILEKAKNIFQKLDDNKL